jgi:predicted enzyme related to lactoylglutathione lyase
MRVKNVFAQSVEVSQLVSFYEVVLGAAPQFVDGDRWAQFKVGDVTVALAGRAEAVSPGTGWVLTVEVPDLDAALARVQEAGGVLVERRPMGGHGEALIIRDPCGNVTALWSAG